MDFVNNEMIWSEKYRPQKIRDCILPDNLKATLQSYVDAGHIPNLLLSGKSGMGKTTAAKAMLKELGLDYIVINASKDGGIETLRVEIQKYASSMSLTGGRKYVILDEADYLSNATQPALRNFMEEYSSGCGFILTCNMKNRIIDALQSRTANIEFKIDKKDLPKVVKEFYDRASKILELEGVKYDKKVLVEVVKKYHPDWRKTLNELQRYGMSGNIDLGALSTITDDSFSTLVNLVRNKNFTDARQWVGENNNIDAEVLIRKFYDHSLKYLEPIQAAQLIQILGEWQFRSVSVPDQEINNMAHITEIMASVTYK